MRRIKKFSDPELLVALKSETNIDDAIRSMYVEYFQTMSNYVLQNSGSEQDAEDVFQDVVMAFVNLVRQEKYRNEAGIKTILFSFTRNIWLNELKRRNRAMKREINFETNKDTIEIDVSHSLEAREMNMDILNLMNKLGDTCKKILTAFYYDNKSMKEILEILHYENEQVVRNKKSKCLKALEQLLAENPQLTDSLKTNFNV